MKDVSLSKELNDFYRAAWDRELARTHTDASLTTQTDLSLSLPEVLCLAECPATGMLGDLAGTSPEREQFQALLSLWQSFGRPTSGFWTHTRVFVNRIPRSL